MRQAINPPPTPIAELVVKALDRALSSLEVAAVSMGAAGASDLARRDVRRAMELVARAKVRVEG